MNQTTAQLLLPLRSRLLWSGESERRILPLVLYIFLAITLLT
ncbi:hypothetical protein OB236_14710 [Paenibacillus sp. WQ 127069]|uniref:ABC transporter permease n=1 Tax=Paenibacillus baimaensis TaxID=2982185 RepID=A0ABT2UFE1_9BACL|nr:hypothetical protein [Paenibacillus sp. WQ 127069]